MRAHPRPLARPDLAAPALLALLPTLLAGGCFATALPVGLRCGPGDLCPPGQSCRTDGLCHLPDAGVDAPAPPPDEPIALPDGALDSDRQPPVDGPVDGVVAEGPTAAPPELPDWPECPPGWTRVTALEGSPEAHAICEPRRPPDESSCRKFEVPTGFGCPDGLPCLLGPNPACRQVGGPCGSAFAPDLPAGRKIIYVQAGGQGSGLTPGDPFGRLQDAVALAEEEGEPAIIAIGAGTLEVGEALTPSSVNLTFWGTCTEPAIRGSVLRAITVPDPGGGPASFRGSHFLLASQGTHELRNLYLDLTLVQAAGVAAFGPAELDLTGVIIEGAVSYAIGLNGRSARLHDVKVTSTRRGSNNNTPGQGIIILGGEVEISASTLNDTRSVGVQILPDDGAGATVTLRDVLVRSTFDDDGALGLGVAVSGPSQVTLERTLLLENRGAGLYLERDASATLTDVAVVQTMVQPGDSSAGFGIDASQSAVTGERVFIEESRSAGVAASSNATVELQQLLVRETRANLSSRPMGHGLLALTGARVSVVRSVITGSDQSGAEAVFIGDGGLPAEILLTDSVITAGDTDPARRHDGIAAGTGSRVSLSRVLVSGQREVGLSSFGGDFELSEVTLACNGVPLAWGEGSSSDRFAITGTLACQDCSGLTAVSCPAAKTPLPFPGVLLDNTLQLPEPGIP